MKKICITLFVIFIILLNNFSHAITLNPFTSTNVIFSYNFELLEMLPKTLNSMNLKSSNPEIMFKVIENLLLLIEAVDTTYTLFPNKLLTEINYRYNSQFDIKNTIINEQNIASSNISRLSLSGTKMRNNGCEVIAVNNAMKLMGYQTSIADLVKMFQKKHAVICDFLISGYLGSNPYSIGKILKAYQIKYDIVSANELNQEGLYIISFWNSTKYTSMLHTVALQIDGNGNYITYNRYGNGKTSFGHPLTNIGSYIIGYRLYSNT